MNIQPDEGFLSNGQYPVLTVMSAGHALQVFINGQLSGIWTCKEFASIGTLREDKKYSPSKTEYKVIFLPSFLSLPFLSLPSLSFLFHSSNLVVLATSLRLCLKRTICSF